MKYVTAHRVCVFAIVAVRHTTRHVTFAVLFCGSQIDSYEATNNTGHWIVINGDGKCVKEY